MSQEQRAIAPGPATDKHSGARVRHCVQKFSHEMRKDSPVTPPGGRRIADQETYLTEFEVCAEFNKSATEPRLAAPLKKARDHWIRAQVGHQRHVYSVQGPTYRVSFFRPFFAGTRTGSGHRGRSASPSVVPRSLRPNMGSTHSVTHAW